MRSPLLASVGRLPSSEQKKESRAAPSSIDSVMAVFQAIFKHICSEEVVSYPSVTQVFSTGVKLLDGVI